jgi:hypothetical protein
MLSQTSKEKQLKGPQVSASSEILNLHGLERHAIGRDVEKGDLDELRFRPGFSFEMIMAGSAGRDIAMLLNLVTR